jgi:tellurite resistance protein
MNAGVEAASTAATLPQARIAKLPAAFFGAVLGLVALGLAWRSASQVFGAPGWIGDLITALGAFAFLLLAAFYAMKMVRAPAAVLAELLHPGQSSFFGTVTISFTLLAAAALPWSRPIAEVLWAAGEALQALLIVVVFRNWIARPMEFEHIHPGWFILMVGIVVGVPPGIAMGHIELSWASLALGTLSAVALYPIVLFRLFFQAPRPTLFILIAPPALIFSAYFSLNGGRLDAFAHGLFFAALFFTTLVLSLPHLFIGLPFAVSWWAYTFPLDAMTVAALAYHAQIGTAASGAVALALLALTTAIVAVVTVRTVLALARGELFGR